MTSRSHLISRLVLRGVLGIALIDVILFGVAGRLDWRAAWVMSGMFAAYVTAGVAWFVRRDPDLMRERITRAANVPIWDRVIYPLYAISLGALLTTAAVDAGRGSTIGC